MSLPIKALHFVRVLEPVRTWKRQAGVRWNIKTAVIIQTEDVLDES